MPRFDFECADCGNVQEAIVGTILDKDATTCKKCSKSNLKKLITGFAFHPEGVFADLSVGERQIALDNKAYIEKNRDALVDGRMTIGSLRRVPHEIRPNV
jgi:putative FmdB family regulatory protein